MPPKPSSTMLATTSTGWPRSRRTTSRAPTIRGA